MSLTVKVARARAGGRAMPGVGDPGVFGWVGKAVGKIAGVVKHLPGPVGWAAGAVSKFLPAGQPAPVAVQQFAPPTFPQYPAQAMPQLPAGISRMGPAPQQTGMEPYSPQLPAVPAVAPTGYHVNESDYFLKDGTFVPAGSRWVKNRKRNPLNPGAASAAIGRIESLKRATKRFSRITIRKKCAS